MSFKSFKKMVSTFFTNNCTDTRFLIYTENKKAICVKASEIHKSFVSQGKWFFTLFFFFLPRVPLVSLQVICLFFVGQMTCWHRSNGAHLKALQLFASNKKNDSTFLTGGGFIGFWTKSLKPLLLRF